MLLISGWSSFYEVILQRELEFKRRFTALIVQSAVIAGVSITLAALGAGVWALVAGQVSALLAFGIVCYTLSPVRVPFAFDRSQARSLFSTGSGFLLQNVAIFARQNTDYIVVGRAFGAAQVGFYSMAYRLGDLTYWAVADPVARVTFPSFSKTLGEGGDIRPSFLSVLRLVALVACPMGILLSGTAEPFTRSLLGERWEPMIGALGVLGLWAAIRPVETTVNWLLNSIGQAKPIGVFSVAVLVPLVPAFVAAAVLGDIRTVAWVVLGDVLVSLAVMCFYAKSRGGVPYRDQWGSVAPIAFACVPTWAASRAVSEALEGSAPGLTFAAAVTAGVVAYLAALSVFAPGLLRDALRQVGRTIGRGAPEPAATG